MCERREFPDGEEYQGLRLTSPLTASFIICRCVWWLNSTGEKVKVAWIGQPEPKYSYFVVGRGGWYVGKESRLEIIHRRPRISWCVKAGW